MAGKRIIALSLFALVALTLAAFASSGTEAGSYKPHNIYTVANPAANATSNNTMTLWIPAPDYNYEDSSMYNLNPIAWQVPMGGQVPFVAGVGNLSSSSTLSTLNSKCDNDVAPSFDLWNASTDPTDTLTPAEMAWTNTADPIPTGTYVAGLRDYLVKYPHFLNLMLDPDGPHGPKPPLTPRARYAGDANVAGSNMLIQVVLLSPGQIAELPGIKSKMPAEMGYMMVTVLNNPVDQAEKPGAVSDFCTPLRSITTYYGLTTNNPATTFNEAGYVGTRNPLANSGVLGTGTHITRNFSQSERDKDGDGLENDLDPCPYTADLLWNPRIACVVGSGLGDNDCDGLPDSCDPVPGTPNTDQDADGYNNRQDICPLVKNGCKTTACGSVKNPSWDNQSDEDGKVLNADLGPSPDSIGDACDDSDCDGVEDGSAAACSCADGIDNGPDGLIDGNDPDCQPKMDAAEVGQCRNDTDEDPANDEPPTGTYGKWINDGCPVKGAVSEATISGACDANNAVDEDGDTRVNDGCPTKGTTAEAAGTTNDADIWGTNPGTGLYYQGMTWAAVCIGAADADGDGYCDALENTLGSPSAAGGGGETICNDGLDNDGDTYINDGCPQVGDYAESGAECADNISNDTPTPDNRVSFGETVLGVAINDGCPAIGVPESLVIDAVINAPGAVPAGNAPASCNDGVDNDGDTKIDLADNGALGCDPAAYTGDADHDGKADAAADNCTTVWNPEQSNTDGVALPKAKGNACDNDDDNDGFSDVDEWSAGSDPLSNTSTPETCDGVNNDLDLKTDGTPLIDEGFPDTNTNGIADCNEDTTGSGCLFDADADTICNGTDVNDDNFVNVDPFSDLKENYMGTDKESMCDNEKGVQCDNAIDDDYDGFVNDGCPQVGTMKESGAGCADAISNDTPADAAEVAAGIKINDGCPTQGDADNDPLDNNKDGKASVADIMTYFAFGEYGTKVADDAQAYKRRLDLNMDKQISVADIMEYFAFSQYGKACPYGL